MTFLFLNVDIFNIYIQKRKGPGSFPCRGLDYFSLNAQGFPSLSVRGSLVHLKKRPRKLSIEGPAPPPLPPFYPPDSLKGRGSGVGGRGYERILMMQPFFKEGEGGGVSGGMGLHDFSFLECRYFQYLHSEKKRPRKLSMQGPRLLFFSCTPPFLAMRYKAQGFPFGKALSLISHCRKEKRPSPPPLERLGMDLKKGTQTPTLKKKTSEGRL
jgi:hypothetical protein